MDDIIKPLSELPADADLTKEEWSWYIYRDKCAIRHINGDTITVYEFPLAVNQVVKNVSEHKVLVIQNTIKRTLGISCRVNNLEVD